MKTMRLFTMLLALSLSVCGMAQSKMNEKASKDARKEAKELKKQGWLTTPGALPLEKQLDRSYQYQYATDDDMNDLWLSGNGQSVGEAYDAAKMQATEVARLELASKISTECTGLIDNLKQAIEKMANSTNEVVGDVNEVRNKVGS